MNLSDMLKNWPILQFDQIKCVMEELKRLETVIPDCSRECAGTIRLELHTDMSWGCVLLFNGRSIGRMHDGNKEFYCCVSWKEPPDDLEKHVIRLVNDRICNATPD